MAKRDKKDEPEAGEDYEFIPPDFDEDAFIHKEMVSFRTTTILFVWGIVAALLSWGILAYMDGAKTAWYIGLLICAAFGYALKFLFPMLGADIAHFGRKEWTGTGFLFFFTWLALFMILINPPITDVAPPEVEVFALPPVQQVGTPVHLEIFAIDNGRIETFNFEVTKGSTLIATEADLTDRGNGHYVYNADLPAARYSYVATAIDAKGHESSATGNFSVSSRAIRYTPPSDNRIDDATDTLVVKVDPTDPPLRTVYLDFGFDRKLPLRYDEETFGGWIATANFAGWQQGNNTFTIKAEQQNTFMGAQLIRGGIVEFDCGGTCFVEVAVETGDFAVKVPATKEIPPNRNVPGPGVALVAAGLVVVAFVARRRN